MTWLKAHRSEEALGLLRRSRNAFALLYLIAHRVRWTEGDDLCSIGEALIGDHQACNLTRGEYRAALNLLKRRRFVTTRTTNRGTVARLVFTGIFDPLQEANDQRNGQRTATKRPANDQPTTTNKKEEGGKAEGSPLTSSQAERISEEKRYKECNRRIREIEGEIGDLDPTQEQRHERSRLKRERAALRRILGYPQ